jgi:hypothetical protein
MIERFPMLIVRSPEGHEFRVMLNKERMTIGRYHDYSDIGLEPDPDHFISREHCVLERYQGKWRVIDTSSENKPLIRRARQKQVIHGTIPLADGDTILIVGKLLDDGGAAYWELIFSDPAATQPAPGGPVVTYLEYDWISARLFRVLNRNREEIEKIPPQEHKLMRHMVQLYETHGNQPVLCGYDELIKSIWGDEPGHKPDEINHLVHGLRRKLEVDIRTPRFLETVSGLGYRLVMYPLPWLAE